jgi:hypothetical protein
MLFSRLLSFEKNPLSWTACREAGSPSGKDIRNLRLVCIGRAVFVTMAVSFASSASDSCGKLSRNRRPPVNSYLKLMALAIFTKAPLSPTFGPPRRAHARAPRSGDLDWVLQRRQSFAREVVWAEQSPGAKLLKMSVLGKAVQRVGGLPRARK